MKYADIIQLQDDFHPVFNLQNEAAGYWKQFVPTPQFYTLLGTLLDTVSSSIPSKRKSIWVQGTFGTGKSHAGSVIQHLLCNDIKDIDQFITDRIENPEYSARLRKLRSEKTFFSVVLSGVQGAYNPRTFALTIERSVKKALNEAGIRLKVNSDFEAAIEILNTNPLVELERILPDAPDLRSLAKNKEAIIKKLKDDDIDVFLALEEALAKYNIFLSSETKLTAWLSEVEDSLREQKCADGLFIFWDEFTSVMDTISSGLINMIQSLAELSEKQNIFLYLISHRHVSAYVGERGEDLKKMNDRFHILLYKMEANTTYKLMSATLRKTNVQVYNKLREDKMPNFTEFVKDISDDTSTASQKDLHDLFPLHPYASVLCSTISRQIGSATRSVFLFLYDGEKGFKYFLETSDADGSLLTADKLWDFFQDVFLEDEDKYNAIIVTLNTHKNTVSGHSPEALKIFKGILLLNALRNLDNERVIPSQENIFRLFEWSVSSEKIENVLAFLNETQIVQKDPSDNFIISLSALSIGGKEREIQRSRFSDAVKILNSNESAHVDLCQIFQTGLKRECEMVFIPASADETRIEISLKKGFVKSYSLRLALILAKTNEERQAVSGLLLKLAQTFGNVIFILFDEVFGDNQQYERFIDYHATVFVAGRRADKEQASRNLTNAQRMVSNWSGHIKNGNYTLFFRASEEHKGATSGATRYINEQIAPRLFTSGADVLTSLRNKPEAVWKTKAAKKVAEIVVMARQRDEILKKLPGADKPADFLLKDDSGNDYIVDTELQLKQDAPDNHPLVLVRKEAENLLEKARKEQSGIFSLGRVLLPLSQMPFGLYPNTPNYFLLAFALRPYISELYDADMGTPLSPDNMRDKTDALFKFFESGNGDNKLRVRFGSASEKKLIDFLVEALSINPENKSIKNVRWEIINYCKTKSRRPLWALKYCDSVKSEVQDIISQLSDLLTKDEVRQDAIEKLWRETEKFQFEFRTLLRTANAFSDGFLNFLKKVPGVQLQDDWLPELEAYLRLNMNAEVGYWTKGDVSQKTMAFYIWKITPSPFTPPPPPPPPPPPSSDIEKKIISASPDKLKSVLRKILQLHPDIATILNEDL
jgi:hypothetical protein